MVSFSGRSPPHSLKSSEFFFFSIQSHTVKLDAFLLAVFESRMPGAEGCSTESGETQKAP